MLNLKRNQISKDHSQGAPILRQPRQPKLCHPLLLLPVISVIGVSGGCGEITCLFWKYIISEIYVSFIFFLFLPSPLETEGLTFIL